MQNSASARPLRCFSAPFLVRAAVVLLLVSATCGVAAAQDAGWVEEEGRPKIGLALSGGGARGIAHVGVLKVLASMGVPVDYIAGTSMGALVGGLYAAGIPLESIEQELTNAGWVTVLSDRTSYRDLIFRRKRDDSGYPVALQLGLRRGRFLFPGSVRSGQRLDFALRRFLLPVVDVTDFSQLKIPFKVLVADIETAETVVLAGGDLPDALQAAMTIPGVFPPVEIDGRLLVDGTVVNNLPVDVVRAMGADVVIAVDLSTPLLDRSELGSLFSVTGQSLNMAIRRAVDAQLAAADLVITPEVDGFGNLSFGSAAAIIERGEVAARHQRQALARLALDAPAYRRHRAGQTTPPAGPVMIDFVRLEGNERVDRRIIERLVQSRTGQPLDLALLEEDLARLYGLDDFVSVTFRLVEEEGEQGLVFRFIEKPWGPTYAHFGFNLQADFEGDTGFGFFLNLTRSRMNALGAEWRNELELGDDLGFFSELYQPLDLGGRLFVAPRLGVSERRQGVYENGRRIADYEVERQELGLDLGLQFGRVGELRFGALRGRVAADVSTGAAELPTVDVDVGGLFTRLSLDTLDSPFIPRRGGRLDARFLLSRTDFGAETEYERLDLAAAHVFSRTSHTWLVGFEGGTSFGSTLPDYDQFLVGGLLSLGGYGQGQLRGQRFGVARLGYYYQLARLPPGVGKGIYLGGFLEGGNVWQRDEDVDLDDLRYTATILIGADTVLGPIFVGYGRADDDTDRVYVTVGRTF